MAELDALIESWTRSQEADDILSCLETGAVPSSRVHAIADIVKDPHYAAREMVQRWTLEHGEDLPMSGVVPRFSRTPAATRSPWAATRSALA